MTTALATIAGDLPQVREAEHETAVTASAAQAKAAVEARYLMALHRPRNMDHVRVRILDACRRPRFAEVARYAKPVGKSKIIGPSIRFAEEAARHLGNLLVETPTVYDDAEKRIVRVMVTDLESNLVYSSDITLSKTVERRTLKDGQVAISQRINSTGEVVYLVAATEDDLANKQGSAISKALRNHVLRVLPSDILDEAMERVVKTIADKDAEDPAAARKRLVDAFFALGIGPDQIAQYLGHPLEQVTPVELADLRTVYAAVKDGEVRWAELVEAKGEQQSVSGTRGGTSLRERVARRATKAEPEPIDQVPSALDPTEEDLALDRRLAAEEGL